MFINLLCYYAVMNNQELKIKSRLIDELKIKIVKVECKPYFEDDNESRNVYTIRVKRNNKSFTFTFGDSITNTQKCKELDNKTIIESIVTSYNDGLNADGFNNFCSRFGYEQTDPKSKRIYNRVIALYEKIHNVFTGSEIEQLQLENESEDFNTDTTKEDIEKFNDDKISLGSDLDKDFASVGIDFNDKKINIALIKKYTKGNDQLLLGETKDGNRIYLERGKFSCGWYYSFGHLHTFDKGELISMWHFDGFNRYENINIRDAIIKYFEGGKLTVTDKELWKLCDLMLSFYTLEHASEFYHRGKSNMADVELNLKSKSMYDKINQDIEKLIIEVQKILNPSGDFQTIKRDKF